jgi:RNA polymerase sigma-70 factor (ECF subfamily)
LDTQEATNLLVRNIGPEILSWLRAVLDSPSDADEVFAAFTEAAWRGLPRFEQKSSFRTWCYAIARNCMNTQLRRASRDRARFGRSAPWSELADEVRQSTAPWLKTDVKDRVRTLRNSLSTDDRTLLVLRVDRGLDWNELAEVWAEGKDLNDAARARLSATLRKRFERIKEQLRARAEKEGLLRRASL